MDAYWWNEGAEVASSLFSRRSDIYLGRRKAA